MSIRTRENSSNSVQVFFLLDLRSLMLDILDTSESSFFYHFFFQHRKTNAMNFTTQKRNFFTAHKVI